MYHARNRDLLIEVPSRVGTDRTVEVPLWVEVTHYTPGAPAIIRGRPEDCHPAEWAEIEYRLYDVVGHPADWVEARVDDMPDRVLRWYEYCFNTGDDHEP